LQFFTIKYGFRKIMKKRIAIYINTPLVGFTDSTHLNCWLQSLNHAIDDKNLKYIYDLFICFLDPDTFGIITSRNGLDDISNFSKDGDHHIKYGNELKSKNIKNIKNLNIPDCINEFKYTITNINCGYGLLEWKFIEEFLNKDEILEYDYVMKCSDASFDFIPNSYTNWIEHHDKFYTDVPITFCSPIWSTYNDMKVGKADLINGLNNSGIILSRSIRKYLIKPKELRRIKYEYNLPLWEEGRMPQNADTTQNSPIHVTVDTPVSYESPFVFLYYYVLYYLRGGKEFTNIFNSSGCQLTNVELLNIKEVTAQKFFRPIDKTLLHKFSTSSLHGVYASACDTFHIESFSYHKVFLEEIKYQVETFDFRDKSDYNAYTNIIFVLENKKEETFQELIKFYSNWIEHDDGVKWTSEVSSLREKIEPFRNDVNNFNILASRPLSNFHNIEIFKEKQ